MRITFLGTGTSHGVPMIGCGCATCTSTDPRDTRLRPSIFVETAGARVLIDAGPDLRAQALRHRITRVDAILFTHGHADHILGMDDVRRFNALMDGAMPCYGDAATLTDIRRMFSYVFDPATPKGGGLPRLDLREIDGPVPIADLVAAPVPLDHGRRPILGFRFDRFAYLTDCNRIPDGSWPLLQGLDVVVLDALRLRPHPTHFSLDEAVATAARIAAPRTFFTHMCHDLLHAATDARLPPGMALAYDGLVLELP
ncbi:MAG TPA: MBL fold metallo-hydrolase [Vicinamibacterales bacterium]|nr:MBL fold metallo-hydrolase [Vicinamibacterales bacterium]